MASLIVGAALSQTGTYAFQGLQALQGLRLWVEETNQQGGLFVPELRQHVPLRLLTYDDHSRRSEVERLIEQLIRRDRVDFLIGPYSSGLTLAAAIVAEAHDRVLWNHGGSSDAIMQRGLRWPVHLPTPASRYFEGLFPLLTAYASPGEHVVVIRRPRGTFTEEVAAGTMQRAHLSGFQALPALFYPEAPEQFARLVRDLAAAEPAIIVGAGRYKDDVTLVRALAEISLKVKALALVATPMQAFWEDLGEGAEGCIGPSQWEPGGHATPDVGPTSAAFIERFRRRYGHAPDYPSAQAYAAGLVIQRCVALAGTCTDAMLLETARRLVCRTFYGRFQLDIQTGAQVGHETVLVQWQGGVKRIIWPADSPLSPLGRGLG